MKIILISLLSILLLNTGCRNDDQEVITVTILSNNSNVINTITNSTTLDTLSTLWQSRTITSAAPNFTHKVDITTSENSTRWMYDPSGYATVLGIKTTCPVYRIDEPEKLREILFPNLEAVTISLDDKHNYVTGNDETLFYDDAPFYEIVACQKLRVDAGSFFSVNQNLSSNAVNSVHIICRGKHDWFRVLWDGRGEIIVEESNLKNILGTMAFNGFISGETYILTVGLDDYPNTKVTISPVWTGMIKVQ